MALPINVQPEARLDIENAVKWYDEASPGLGWKFLLAVDHAFTTIQDQPHTWPKYKNSMQYYVMRRFPYTIFYRVRNDDIWIVSVAHQKRKPEFWIDR